MVYVGFALAAIVAIIAGIIFSQYKEQKQARETAESELETSRKRLKKADAMYRETVQAKDNLTLMYEDLKVQYEKSNRLAYTDSLTGLPNMEQASGMLESICQTLRNGEAFAVSVVSVGEHTSGSDITGKSAREDMLLDITQRLKANISFNEDYLARTGENAFMLVSQNFDDLPELDARLQKLFKILALPYASGGKEYIPEIHMATVIAPHNGKTPQLLMMNVDLALNEAKKSEESNFVYYDENLAKRAMDRMEMQADLRRAVSDNSIEYLYEVQMDLKKGQVDTIVITPVWNHPSKGKLSFGGFRETLEECEICMEAYDRMVNAACDMQRRMDHQGHDALNIAIPVLARQALDENFMKRSYELVENAGADPARLIFQIPYRAVQKQPERMKDMIQKMVKFGFRFRLDDYKAENLSLNTVMSMPFAGIIISENLFRGAEADIERQMPSLTAFFHNAKKRVIVTGTEFQEQENFLRKANCDLASGELYSGTMNGEIISQFLRLQKK